MNLLPGDVFCVEGSMPGVTWLIRLAERFWSIDNQADYGHSGIIISPAGDTFEMLWTAKKAHLDQYKGQNILIARPVRQYIDQEPIRQQLILENLQALMLADTGHHYPIHRLILHLIPPLAKYMSLKHLLVCSEEVAKFLGMIGARPCIFSGVNPDTLADEFIAWRNFEVIYQGVWTC